MEIEREKWRRGFLTHPRQNNFSKAFSYSQRTPRKKKEKNPSTCNLLTAKKKQIGRDGGRINIPNIGSRDRGRREEEDDELGP